LKNYTKEEVQAGCFHSTFVENFNQKNTLIMKKRHKLLISMFSTVLLSSCIFMWDPDPEAENELRIVNNTSDTLIIGYSRDWANASDYEGEPSLVDKVELYPYENYRYCGMLNASLVKLLKGRSEDKRDTMKIYKAVCETCEGKLIHDRGGNLTIKMGEICYAKWGGPVVSLPDSIHTFYNTNSWVITTDGPKKRKRTIATFTITDEDLSQN